MHPSAQCSVTWALGGLLPPDNEATCRRADVPSWQPRAGRQALARGDSRVRHRGTIRVGAPFRPLPRGPEAQDHPVTSRATPTRRRLPRLPPPPRASQSTRRPGCLDLPVAPWHPPTPFKLHAGCDSAGWLGCSLGRSLWGVPRRRVDENNHFSPVRASPGRVMSAAGVVLGIVCRGDAHGKAHAAP